MDFSNTESCLYYGLFQVSKVRINTPVQCSPRYRLVFVIGGRAGLGRVGQERNPPHLVGEPLWSMGCAFPLVGLWPARLITSSPTAASSGTSNASPAVF